MEIALNRKSPGIVIITTLYLLLAIVYGIVTPVFEAPDEVYHFEFVKRLVDQHYLPIQTTELGRSESHQAPLYYAVGALATFWIDTNDFPEFRRLNPFWGSEIHLVGGDNRNQFLHNSKEAFPYSGTPLALHLLRVLSALFGIVSVVFTYLIASEVFPGRRALALMATAFVALNPQFVFVNSYANNDSPLIALSSVAIYFCLRWQRKGELSIWKSAWLGVLVGSAALVKVSGIVFLPMVVLTLAAISLPRRQFARALQCGAVAVGVVAIFVGWWIARNLWLYGEWSGMDRMYTIWNTRRSSPLDIVGIVGSLPRVWDTYWGVFGRGNVPMDSWIYQGLAAIALVALLSVTIRLGTRVKLPRSMIAIQRDLETASFAYPRVFPLVFLALWQALMLISLVAYIRAALYADFGRFLFPGIAFTGVILAWGLSDLAPNIIKRSTPWLATAGMAALSLLALLAYLIPAYFLPASAIVTGSPAGSVAPAANFANLAEIDSYEIKSAVASPGQTIDIALVWRPLRKVDQDYAVFVHLLSSSGNDLVAQTDVYPGGGRMPTSAWTPGQPFRDTYRILVPDKLSRPLLLNLEMGLFNVQTSERLMLLSGEKGVESNALRLGSVKVPLQEPSSERQSIAKFEEDIDLDDARFSLTPPEDSVNQGAGQNRQLAVQLLWRANDSAEPHGDYTVFVHVIDDSGKVIAQHDGKPASANYPTPVWGRGEVIPDIHSIELAPDLQPGKYTIEIGLYDFEQDRRLRVIDPSTPQIDSAVRFAWSLRP